MATRLYHRLSRCISVSVCFAVLGVTLASGLRSRRRERLLKVGNDVVNVLRTDGDTDEILGNTTVDTLFFAKLFVSCRPRVDGESLGVANAVVSSLVRLHAIHHKQVEKSNQLLTWRDSKSA